MVLGVSFEAATSWILLRPLFVCFFWGGVEKGRFFLVFEGFLVVFEGFGGFLVVFGGFLDGFRGLIVSCKGFEYV